MVANANQHAHLHQAKRSLSHVSVPDHKANGGSLSHVKGPPIHIGASEAEHVKGPPIQADNNDSNAVKGMPLHVEAAEKTNNKGSLSHVKIPEHKKNGGSLSHVKIPEHKKNGGSLSHLELPDWASKGPHDLAIDNKLAFIHNYAKDRLVASDSTVTADSIVYVTATGAPDLAGTPTAAPDGPSPTGESRAEQSYLSAKNKANQPHTWTKQSQSQAAHTETTHHVGHPIQTSRAAETPSSVASSVATSPAVVTSAAVSSAALSSSVYTNPSSSALAAANSLPSTTAPALTSNSKSSSGGLSSGGKAGVAFGVILGLALIAGLALLFWRRRKAQTGEADKEVTDEKHGSFFGSNQAAPSDYRGSVQSARSTASTAPRLSLRPVTQFLPNIGAQSNDTSADKPKSSWERKQSNPFDDDAVVNEKQSQVAANPFDEGDGRKSPSESSTVTAVDGPDSPKSARSANGAAAAPGPRGPNNVHRVQLDFKPTMDDELELKSGQLVRMLHEYDDGWALCIRMDRSQQGVCPRTCLSKLPVKPRPQGPPPNGRPMPPPGATRGPSPPNAGGMVPRPLTPNGQQSRERSQTLNKTSPTSSVHSSQGSPRSRSQSVTAAAAPASVPSRKPVPGQAL